MSSNVSRNLNNLNSIILLPPFIDCTHSVCQREKIGQTGERSSLRKSLTSLFSIFFLTCIYTAAKAKTIISHSILLCLHVPNNGLETSCCFVLKSACYKASDCLCLYILCVLHFILHNQRENRNNCYLLSNLMQHGIQQKKIKG